MIDKIVNTEHKGKSYYDVTFQDSHGSRYTVYMHFTMLQYNMARQDILLHYPELEDQLDDVLERYLEAKNWSAEHE